MQLIDLLEVIDENTKQVNVLDLNGCIITVYDGKNAIEKRYNSLDVAGIRASKQSTIDITVKIIKIG